MIAWFNCLDQVLSHKEKFKHTEGQGESKYASSQHPSSSNHPSSVAIQMTVAACCALLIDILPANVLFKSI